MPITTTDELTAAVRSAQSFQKASVASAAGQYASLWTAAGLPAAGSAPGAAALCNGGTAGAIGLPALSAGQKLYLAAVSAAAGTAGTIVLFDRIAHMGGLSGILTTAQAVNTPAPDARYASQDGTLAWLEWYTATGATAVTATVTYTNSAGVAGRTATVSIPASQPAGRMIPIPLAAGDKGVQSVQSVQLSASTATAGNFGVTIARQLDQISIATANVGGEDDYTELGLPEVGSAAVSLPCLFLAMLASTTSTGVVSGTVTPAVST